MVLTVAVGLALFIWVIYRVGVAVVEDSLEGRELGALSSLGAFFLMLTLGAFARATLSVQLIYLFALGLALIAAIWLARSGWLAPSSFAADGWVFCTLITSILMNPLILGPGGPLGPFGAIIATIAAAASFVVIRRAALMLSSQTST